MQSWGFVHNWYMPFVFALVSTVLTVPLAVYFQSGMAQTPAAELGLGYGSGWVLRDDFLASVVAYTLSLGAVVWLFDGDGSTRWAAFWATLFGAARLAVPIVLVSMSDVTVAGERHYIDWNVLRVVIWFQDAQMLVLGVMLWGAFGRFVGSSSGAGPSRSMHYAEA
jgi:hypothetical protein